ncbi:MAG: hypothetical protein L0H73_02265 [Nitrococcus sp.]|nr:hypothetical protein [Nitrococcus sp.]
MRFEQAHTDSQARRLPQEVATRLLDRLPLICVMLLLIATVACGETPRADPATHAQQLPELRADQPASEKISRNLAPLLTADNPARFRELAAEQGFSVRPRGVLIDVQTQGLTAADRARFQIKGVTIDHFSVKYQRVSAVVRDPVALRVLAALPVVRYIAPEYGAVDRSTGRNIDY